MTHRNQFDRTDDQEEPQEGPETPVKAPRSDADYTEEALVVDRSQKPLSKIIVSKHFAKEYDLNPDEFSTYEVIDVVSTDRDGNPTEVIIKETDVRKHRKSQHSNLEEN
jgi:hypothetical protein